MLPDRDVRIIFDYKQQRVKADRLTVLVSGKDFDGTENPYSNTWLSPVCDTTILLPKCLEEPWATLSSGDYAKLPLSAFTVATGAQWVEKQDQAIAGPWLTIQDTAFNEPAITTATIGKNRGVYVAYYSAGSGTGYWQFACGFNDTPDYLQGTSLRFHSHGHAEARINGKLIKKSGFTTVSSAQLVKQERSEQGRNTHNTLVELLILPYRRQDILVYSISHGGGFYFTNEDVDPYADDIEIIPDTNFWFDSISGLTQVMVAPLVFNTSGYRTSRNMSFFEAPTVEDTKEEFPLNSWNLADRSFFPYADKAYHGTQSVTCTLQDEDLNEFVADDPGDGTGKSICNVKVELSTTDKNYTPFFYGVSAGYTLQVGDTDDSEEADAINYVNLASLTVGDRFKDTSLSFTVHKPKELSQIISGLDVQENRPIAITIDGITYLDGVNKFDENKLGMNDLTSRITFDAFTRASFLHNYRFVERFSFDGWQFRDAIIFLVKLMGYKPGNIDVAEYDLELNYQNCATADEFTLEVQVNDTALYWLETLFEKFAGTWYYGERPTLADGISFYAYPPEDLGTDPVITLYSTLEEAMSYESLYIDEARLRVFRSLKTVPLVLEANDLRITGYNPRTDKVIQTYSIDYESQRINTKPSLRPVNWRGEILRAGITDGLINNQATCDEVCEIVANRVFVPRYIHTIECTLLRDELNVPYWKGIPIKLVSDEHSIDVVTRIQSFSFEMNFQSKNDWFDKCNYLLRSPIDI